MSLFPYTLLLKEDGNFYSLFLYILLLKEPGDSPVPFHFFFLLKGDGNFHVPNLGSLSGYWNMEISMCLYVVLHKGTWKFPCMYLSLLPKEHGNFRVLYPLCKPGNLLHIFSYRMVRDTQRHISENICSGDDLRSRILGTFVVRFRACLPLLGFSNIQKML